MQIRVSILATALALAFPIGAAAQATEIELGQVVVTATRTATRADQLLSDVSVIDRAEIEAAGSMTLGELLARQPGIQFSQAGGAGKAASLFLRGTNSGHVLVLIDGVRTGSATLGVPSIQSISLDQIERIEILRGPASALYGSDGIGGVVQVFTRDPSTAGQFQPRLAIGAGSYDLRKSSAGFSGVTGGWSYVLDATYSEQSGFSVLQRGTGDDDNDGDRSTNASGRLTYKVGAGHELGSSFYYSKGRSSLDDPFDPTPANLFSDTETSSIALFSKNKLTDSWQSTLQLGNSSDKSVDTYSLWLPTSHYQTQQDQLSWINDITTGLGSLLIGYEFLGQSIKTDDNYSETDRHVNSGLLGWRASFGDHQLQANVRHDDSSAYGAKTTGALGYGYHFSRTLRMQTSYGTSFKAPSFNDMYWPYNAFVDDWGTTYVTEGNPDLKPEAGRNREISLLWDDGHNSASATYYLNKVRNLIDWEFLQSAPNTFVYRPNNVGRARLEGVTLQAASHWRAWKASAAVDFLDARDEDSGDRLQRRAARTATLTLEHRDGFATTGAQLHAAGPRYNDSGERTRLGGYGTLDLYARKPLDGAWSLEARINNLFDKKYALIEGYNTPGLNAFVGLRYAPR